jgi:chemotaxis protein methyltransferase WspC
VTIEHLVQTLVSKFGWQLESHRPEAVERALLARTLKLGTSSSEVYLRDLKPDGPEFNLLLEELVVPESWFYRERETLSFLLEQLTAHSYCETDPLRVLCVPCARGEEPSSLAMMLQQAGWPASRRTLEAVDLSRAAIDSALLGRYRGHSFRGNLMGFRSEFFKELVDQHPLLTDEQQSQIPKTNLWELSEPIRNSIQYSVQNVFELPDRYTSYDVILCRHLLIYLTPSARDRLFEIVAERLKPNGLLVVAACEFALPPLHRFTPISREGIVLFRNQPSPAPQSINHSTRPSLLKTLPSRPLHANPSKDRHSLSIPTRLDQSPKTNPIPLTGEPATIGALAQAKAEADLGRLHSALELCQQAIAAKPSAEAYCLQGLVQSALNDQSASEASFRKALYLDPDNKEALNQLALIKEAAGDLEGAKRLRERLNR